MSRPAKWPPPIQFHRASGQARVRIAGKDHYLGPHGSQEAQEAYARLLASLTSGKPPERPKGGATVAEVVAAFLDYAAEEYSARGRELEQFRLALRPLVRLHGTLAAADFGTVELESVQEAMASGSWMTPAERAAPSRRGVVGACRNVVNARVNRIRRMWRWAERKGLAPKGSWANLRTVPGLKPTSRRVRHTAEVAPADLAELCRVLRRCPYRAVRAILRLIWYSGARTGEACRMRPCDIDRSGPVWLYRPAEHKCDWRGQPRIIGLGPRCQRVLARWLARSASPDAYLFRPLRRKRRGHYVSATLAQRVRPAAEAAGVVGFFSYRLRHSYKQRVTRELGLDHARSALGQKSLDTTNSYSAGIDLKLAEEVARRLG